MFKSHDQVRREVLSIFKKYGVKDYSLWYGIPDSGIYRLEKVSFQLTVHIFFKLLITIMDVFGKSKETNLNFQSSIKKTINNWSIKSSYRHE